MEGWFAQCIAANPLSTPNDWFPELSDLHDDLHLGDVASRATIPLQTPPVTSLHRDQQWLSLALCFPAGKQAEPGVQGILFTVKPFERLARQVPPVDKVLVAVTIPSQRWVVLRNSGKDSQQKQWLWAGRPVSQFADKYL